MPELSEKILIETKVQLQLMIAEIDKILTTKPKKARKPKEESMVDRALRLRSLKRYGKIF